MIRLLGFLVGSAASIGMILLILGVPEINLSKQVIDDQNIEAVSQIVEDVKIDLESIVSEVIDEITDESAEKVADEVTNDAGEFVDELPAAESNNAEIPTESPEPISNPVTPEESQFAELLPVQPNKTANDIAIPNDLRWHAFWNPFRSRIAAEGFVGQLEKVTGLDYRVVKIKTGVYEVTFAYQDDAERRNKMSLIASATGLDLPES